MDRRVLITGHRGYIGSVMAPHLQRAGYDVVGLDAGYFDECTLVPDPSDVPYVRKDLRHVEPRDLHGFDAVIHLAALSNDPIGNLNAAWTRSINLEGSVRLARAAKEAGVARFLFSSSCIMYGDATTEWVDEASPLDPKTEYARSKVEAERRLAELADADFAPTFIRNGTIYGVSPRMRFDTVLNDLVAQAVTSGVVQVHGDGRPWRPVSHVVDVARYFQRFLEAPLDETRNQAFNAGADAMNHQVAELASIVTEEVTGSRVQVLARDGADRRTYRARFAKFQRAFPDFRFQYDARAGVRQLRDAYMQAGVDAARFQDPRFTRLKWLRHLLDTKRLGKRLEWIQEETQWQSTA